MSTLKDFNDFLNFISPELMSGIFDDANKKAADIREKITLNDAAWLGNQIGIVSYTIALEILGLYHKWLEQESEDS